MTKYFKTTIHYEIISVDEPFQGTLEQAAYETSEGAMSGRFLDTDTEELTREEASEALIEQGSDPEFLLPEEEESEDSNA